jgi:hypothetical protein
MQVLANLRAKTPTRRRADELGDRFMPGYEYGLRSPQAVRRDFGQQFAKALFGLGPGWHGPIASSYGLHLVHVDEKVEGRIPEYAEVREQLVLDFTQIRRNRAKEALYEGLSKRYEIEIDQDAIRQRALEAMTDN